MDRWDIRSVAVAGSAWCGECLSPTPRPQCGKAHRDVLWLDWSWGSYYDHRYTLAITSGDFGKKPDLLLTGPGGRTEHPRPHGEVEG